MDGVAFPGEMLLVLVGLVCAVPIYLIMAAWAEGVVDAAVGISVACIAVGLFVCAWLTRDSAVMLCFAALLLGLCLGVPFYYWKQGKMLHQKLDEDDIARYHAALQRDSRNSGAHALLGEAYFKKHLFVEAVAHYEAALTLSPDPETNPRVTKWTRRLEEARAARTNWEMQQARRTRT
jgi:tetratricopeptide (TPR) repeat protein